MIATRITTIARPSPRVPCCRRFLGCFILISESDCFHDLPIADERGVRLFSGERPKAVARVHLEFDQPPVEVLPVRPEIGRLGLLGPFDFRAVRIHQILLNPIPDDLLIEFGKRSADRGIDRSRIMHRRRCQDRAHDAEGQEQKAAHPPTQFRTKHNHFLQCNRYNPNIPI